MERHTLGGRFVKVIYSRIENLTSTSSVIIIVYCSLL